MSEPSARQRFVEAMRVLYLWQPRKMVRQAIEAFADVMPCPDEAHEPQWDRGRCVACCASLLKECGL